MSDPSPSNDGISVEQLRTLRANVIGHRIARVGMGFLAVATAVLGDFLFGATVALATAFGVFFVGQLIVGVRAEYVLQCPRCRFNIFADLWAGHKDWRVYTTDRCSHCGLQFDPPDSFSPSR